MFEQIIDLSLIPFSGPFKNLRDWLLWRLARMKATDTLSLPIFSAFKILRFSEGYVLENNATGQVWAASADNYVQILEFIETQRPQTKPNWHERALIRYAKAAQLHKQGMTGAEIAKLIKTSKSRAVEYVERYHMDWPY